MAQERQVYSRSDGDPVRDQYGYVTGHAVEESPQRTVLETVAPTAAAQLLESFEPTSHSVVIRERSCSMQQQGRPTNGTISDRAR